MRTHPPAGGGRSEAAREPTEGVVECGAWRANLNHIQAHSQSHRSRSALVNASRWSPIMFDGGVFPQLG